jgi:hypothetical protein
MNVGLLADIVGITRIYGIPNPLLFLLLGNIEVGAKRFWACLKAHSQKYNLFA